MADKSIKVGIIQASPVHLDKNNSMKKASRLIMEAAEKKADLVVFGETWLTGYPAWIDHCPQIAQWGYPPAKNIYGRMIKNSVTVPGKETERLGQWAKKFQLSIAIGVNESVESGPGNGTLYNSFLLFNSQGELVNHHRKLMPTFNEKLFYGQGDGFGLKTVSMPWGRIGGLICWEHWMPLARQALHSQGEILHLALWPEVNEIHQMASRHYAFEGRCYVVAVGQIMKASDIPVELDRPEKFAGEKELILKGGSCVIAPDGTFLRPPLFDFEGVWIEEINDLDMCLREKITLDTSGHYYRNDIFTFSVNGKRG